jgi:hypothetical protein
MLKLAILLTAAALAPPLTQASTFTFGGTLGQDDSIEWFRVQMDSPGTLKVRTTSFANGGFAPVLSLFEEAGSAVLFATNHAGGPGPGCGPRSVDPVVGFCWDGYIEVSTDAGFFLLALTQDDNLPVGPFLTDGFSRTGQGNFTGPDFAGQPGSFLLITGDQRTANWALEIDADGAVALPEPSTLQLLGAGVVLILIGRGRKA